MFDKLKFVALLVLDQIELEPPPLLLPRDEKNTADRFDRAAFAADYPAHIARGDANLDADVLAVNIFRHLDRVRFTDQRAYDPFYSFSHF